jgi:hypothetical protein
MKLHPWRTLSPSRMQVRRPITETRISSKVRERRCARARRLDEPQQAGPLALDRAASALIDIEPIAGAAKRKFDHADANRACCFAIRPRNSIFLRNFHVVSMCSPGNGIRTGNLEIEMKKN